MSPLSHTPVRAVRDLMPEQVFSSMWFDLMHRPIDDDDDFLGDHEGPVNGERLSSMLRAMWSKTTDRNSKVCADIRDRVQGWTVRGRRLKA